MSISIFVLVALSFMSFVSSNFFDQINKEFQHVIKLESNQVLFNMYETKKQNKTKNKNKTNKIKQNMRSVTTVF